jgi:integrase/recombinase XerD
MRHAHALGNPRRPESLTWLGQASLQSKQVYLRADPSDKLEALAAMTPPMLKPSRFRAPDKVQAMLNTAGRKSNYEE